MDHDPEPFTLEDPTPHRPWHPEPRDERQRALFSGLDEAPGQMDLFEDIDKPED